MADLYTNRLTLTGSRAYLESFVEILTVAGGSQSPASLVLTDSGALNLVVGLDTRAVTLQAFTGDDVIKTSQVNDSVLRAAGNDVMIPNDDDDTLVGGFGDDQMAGGNGNDVFELTGDNDGMRYCQIRCLRIVGHAVIRLFSVVSIPSLNMTPVMLWLGSRLIDNQSQNKTVAARAMADRKTFGHLS